MATAPVTPTQPGADQASAPSAPSQAPAPPEMMMLSRISQALARLAQTNPVLSAGLQKAVQGINEAQSALVSQPKPESTGQNPMY